MGFGLVVDVTELSVTVTVLRPFGHLGIGLQAVAQVVQQVPDQVRAHLVTQASHFTGKGPGRFERPAQRRHRITTAVGLDQGVQHHQQLRVQIHLALRTSPGPAHPVLQTRPLGQLLRSGDKRVTAHPRRLGHPGLPPDPTSTIDAPSSLRWRSFKNG